MKNSIKSLCCLLIITALAACGGLTESAEERERALRNEATHQEFSKIFLWYTASAKGGWKNNDEGRFSNDDAPALESLTSLYKSTGDGRYLETAFQLGEKIIAANDEVRFVQDAYRSDRVIPGWSSTRYTKDKRRTHFLLNDALIAIQLVQSHRNVKGTAREIYAPASWLAYSERVFNDLFVADWKQINESSGFFEDNYFPSIEKIRMPVNQYATAGLFALELYKATGKAEYRTYATQTGNFLKSQLILRDNAYVWCYAKFSDNDRCTNMEDFSHAQLVTRFIVAMQKSNLVFNEVDISRIVKTVTTQIITPSGVSFYVGGKPYADGTGSVSYKANAWLHYFMELVEFDSQLAAYMKSYLAQWKIDYVATSDFNHLGEFALLHYAYSIQYFGQNLCGACTGPYTQ